MHFGETNHMTFFSTLVWASQFSTSEDDISIPLFFGTEYSGNGHIRHFAKMGEKNKFLPEDIFSKLLPF